MDNNWKLATCKQNCRFFQVHKDIFLGGLHHKFIGKKLEFLDLEFLEFLVKMPGGISFLSSGNIFFVFIRCK